MKGVVPAGWEVPARFRQRTGQNAGRQRAMVDSGHLLLILHEVPDPASPEDRRARLLWRLPDGGWKSTGLGKGTQALRAHLGEYEAALAGIEKRLEAAKAPRDLFEAMHALTPLFRATRGLAAALQQARELGGDDQDVITERDRAGDLERTAELLYQDAQHRLDLSVALRAEEQAEQAHRMARSAHKLNLLAALFFPTAAIASLLGMNVDHGISWMHGPFAFWGVLAACLLLGLVLRRSVS